MGARGGARETREAAGLLRRVWAARIRPHPEAFVFFLSLSYRGGCAPRTRAQRGPVHTPPHGSPSRPHPGLPGRRGGGRAGSGRATGAQKMGSGALFRRRRRMLPPCERASAPQPRARPDHLAWPACCQLFTGCSGQQRSPAPPLPRAPLLFFSSLIFFNLPSPSVRPRRRPHRRPGSRPALRLCGRRRRGGE